MLGVQFLTPSDLLFILFPKVRPYALIDFLKDSKFVSFFFLFCPFVALHQSNFPSAIFYLRTVFFSGRFSES